MNVQAEVSLYPLRSPELSQPIRGFSEALAKRGLRIETGNMSTSVAGELGHVFDGLKSAMEQVAQDHEVVLVVKVSNACPDSLAAEQDEERASRGRPCAPGSGADPSNSMRRK